MRLWVQPPRSSMAACSTRNPPSEPKLPDKDHGFKTIHNLEKTPYNEELQPQWVMLPPYPSDVFRTEISKWKRKEGRGREGGDLSPQTYRTLGGSSLNQTQRRQEHTSKRNVSMHPCMHTYVHIYIGTYTCTYIHTYIPTYLHTYPCIHAYTHTLEKG